MTLGLAILSCALAAGTCHPSADPGVRSFAVRVHGPAQSTAHLVAVGVPRGWIASFCTARVCSPFRVALPLHAGTATIQLSYARTGAAAGPAPTPHVEATL